MEDKESASALHSGVEDGILLHCWMEVGAEVDEAKHAELFNVVTTGEFRFHLGNCPRRAVDEQVQIEFAASLRLPGFTEAFQAWVNCLETMPVDWRELGGKTWRRKDLRRGRRDLLMGRREFAQLCHAA